MKRVRILTVPIDDISQQEAMERMCAWAKEDGRHHVMTPNPEMLVAARKDVTFRELLSRTSMNLPDGFGLLWAAKRKGEPLRERVTGTDMLIALSKHCDEKIFFLGGADGVAESAKHRLTEKNPNLKVVGTFAGSPHPSEEQDIVDRINASGATMLFVAFGAPQQDLWIDRVLPTLTTVRVAMGIGGAFDFVVGKQKRAPEWIRNIGFEWFWRLLHEPKRWRRIFNAVVVFPYLVVRYDQR